MDFYSFWRCFFQKNKGKAGALRKTWKKFSKELRRLGEERQRTQLLSNQRSGCESKPTSGTFLGMRRPSWPKVVYFKG